MKPVKRSSKLQLKKETLRDLSTEQLAMVGGATGEQGGTCPLTPSVTTITTVGPLSTPQLSCTGSSILTPSGTINPNPSVSK